MSKERELIDKYYELLDEFKKYKDNQMYDKFDNIKREIYRSIYNLSYYERDNVGNIENYDLLDITMIKGINDIYYDSKRNFKPCDICPPTYQKLDNNKIMVIADIHYISKNIGKYKYHEDSLNYVNAALYYAKEKGIKEIVILGDLVDGKYSHTDDAIRQIINNKTGDDLLNEVYIITSLIRKKLPDVKIRVVLGNHDINAINIYDLKLGNAYKGFYEYLSIYKDNNIKLDGLGETIYKFGDNYVLLEHCINKPFGLYNPLDVEYKYENDYTPIRFFRSISGHSHYFSSRCWYPDKTDISNIICPSLKADYNGFQLSSCEIEYPGFLILDSIGDKIIIEPFFINKLSNGEFYIDSLESLCKLSKTEEGRELKDKYRTFYKDKKIVLDKVIY